jgi:hypothetical protein
VLALPDAIEAASPERREELCRIVVQRVVMSNRQLAMIDWTPAVRPFFEKQRVCPQGDLSTRPPTEPDLSWYEELA